MHRQVKVFLGGDVKVSDLREIAAILVQQLLSRDWTGRYNMTHESYDKITGRLIDVATQSPARAGEFGFEIDAAQVRGLEFPQQLRRFVQGAIVIYMEELDALLCLWANEKLTGRQQLHTNDPHDKWQPLLPLLDVFNKLGGEGNKNALLESYRCPAVPPLRIVS